MTQIMFDWQNVGRQKIKIDATDEEVCPTQCSEYKSHGHYLECNNKEMQQYCQRKQLDLRQQLLKLRTYPFYSYHYVQLLYHYVQLLYYIRLVVL